jgi:hypothetical protein
MNPMFIGRSGPVYAGDVVLAAADVGVGAALVDPATVVSAVEAAELVGADDFEPQAANAAPERPAAPRDLRNVRLCIPSKVRNQIACRVSVGRTNGYNQLTARGGACERLQ